MEINVKVSKQLAAVLSVLHLGAIAILLLLVRPWPLGVALAGMVAISLAWQLRRVYQAKAGAIRKLVWTADGEILLGSIGERPARTCQLIGSRKLAGTIILKLDCAGGRRPVFLVLARDALDPEEARQLRSYARSREVRPPAVTA